MKKDFFLKWQQREGLWQGLSSSFLEQKKTPSRSKNIALIRSNKMHFSEQKYCTYWEQMEPFPSGNQLAAAEADNGS